MLRYADLDGCTAYMEYDMEKRDMHIDIRDKYGFLKEMLSIGKVDDTYVVVYDGLDPSGSGSYRFNDSSIKDIFKVIESEFMRKYSDKLYKFIEILINDKENVQ